MGTLLCCAGGFVCTALSSFQPVPNSTLKGSYYFLLFFTVLVSLLFIFHPGYSAYWISFIGTGNYSAVDCSNNCGALLTNRLWLAFAVLCIVQVFFACVLRGKK